MIQYKYSLDKSSKKFICPKCNKKTFVKYLETETGKILNEDLGRCDRETNCGYHSTPIGEYKNTFEYKKNITLKTSFHDYELISQSCRNYKKNNFVHFLKSIFSDEEIKKAIQKYLIGTSKRWDGATVFWQMDNLKLIRAGKILQYDVVTGKRLKDENGKGLIDWTHSILKRNNLLKEFNLSQCLFGLHLINETNNKTIALVEGEKTAIIMSIFKPEYIWLSTGSKHGLKYEFLKPIKDYKIVAFPDKSEYDFWLNRAIELNGYGFNIIVNDWLEQQTNFETGTDLADVYIFEKKSINISSKVVFDYSNSEYIVHELEQHTPEIWELINTFELVDKNGNEIRKIV